MRLEYTYGLQKILWHYKTQFLYMKNTFLRLVIKLINNRFFVFKYENIWLNF